SLPIARSTETFTERDTSSREGHLAHTSVPELLARAYRVSFSGSLVLEPTEGAPSTVRFVGGAVIDTSGPWWTPEREWEVLGRLLPSDTLEFARQHATDYGVTPFAAVERLVLLPPESLLSARQALTALGVETLAELSGDVRYAFVAPTEADEGGAVGLEPLGLLATCFLLESQRERAARSLAPFEFAVFSPETERSRRVLPTLNGPVRAVLEALARSPSNVHSLRERKLLPSAELVAALCALWITREIVVKSPDTPSVPPARPRSEPPSPSVQPRKITPPFVPAASMAPPRKDSGFVRAQPRSASLDPKEQAMVLKVEEAWARAQVDPSRAQQISSVVHKAVAVFPRNPRLHYYMAQLHAQASRIAEAVSELERVVELDPTDERAARELADLKSRSDH
ncbi:MAG TPA: tetratricopeptide repeat protein, partial [Polyangiaceae bacterium]